MMLFIINFNNQSVAQDKVTDNTEWYAGTNPLAIPLGFNIKPELKRFLPIVAGNEYGVNFVVGHFLRSHISVEGRISLSYVHRAAFVGQCHLGANYFFQKNQILNGNKGWYFGAYARYWDFHNMLIQIDFHNINPYLSLGYMKGKN